MASEFGHIEPDEEGLFYDQLTYAVLHQYAAFNSPVWFNVGLRHKYGIKQVDDKRIYGYDRVTGKVEKVDPYERPQGSACFIISVDDSIDDIWNLMSESARLFKYGSGVGADWSKLRSSKEKLSGGGTPSGPVSFMKVQDSTASTIKSGGKTRRAAIMQTLNVHHPDIMEFVNAKQEEEKKAWALIEEGYDGSFNGDAYGSVAFQNVNQSVRVTDNFMGSMAVYPKYSLYGVDGEEIAEESPDAVMKAIAEGTHICGDPGVQYEDTITRWHTVPNFGPINSSNPCSEFLHPDNTACNLASINLKKFWDPYGLGVMGMIDVKGLGLLSRLLIIAMDVLVDLSGYPSEAIAKNSHDLRPLGLGFANLGALLMSMGLPYDSDEGRRVAGDLMAIIHANAYFQSSLLAEKLGPFTHYEANKDHVLRVLEQHANAHKRGVDYISFEAETMLETMVLRARTSGVRNSQVTVLAPTGTISFMMGCDTTGIEPSLGLVQYKLLAGKGDGMITIVNQSVKDGLRELAVGREEEMDEIMDYIIEHNTIVGAPWVDEEHYDVFATSFGESNTLSWQSHLRMMAACQPFVSGAISKTINMPEESTVEEIEDAYVMGWELGLKAVAIYRNNSKRSQPVSVTKNELPVEVAIDEPSGDGQASLGISLQSTRKRLPDERPSITHKFSVGGHEGYIHVGLYPETRKPGEVFITMSKQGSTISGMMDAFATAVSVALQWGVPLEDLVKKFTHTRFEPAGFTSNAEVRQCTSVIDYIFKWLDLKFNKEKIEIDLSDVPEDFWDGSETTSTRPGEPYVTVPYEKMTNGTTVREPIAKEVVHTGDAPPCSVCGTITQRAGSCYTCPSCGNSTGCG